MLNGFHEQQMGILAGRGNGIVDTLKNVKVVTMNILQQSLRETNGLNIDLETMTGTLGLNWNWS